MKIRLRYLARISFIGFIMVLMCLGCAGVVQKLDEWQYTIKDKLRFDSSDSSAGEPGDGSEQFGQSDEFFVHRSRWSWETLAYVAEWYTGESRNWKILAEINPDVASKKLAVGSEIFIPVELLRTRESLPRNFTGEYRKDSNKRTVRSSKRTVRSSKRTVRSSKRTVRYYRHTVRWPGESLSLIAKWYTGSTGNWRKLAKSNPRIHPYRIKVGEVILIPPGLLKTRKPLPQKVAARYTSHYFVHTVKSDREKLKDIAGWYTGNPANWKTLANVNPSINPRHLLVGNEIFIPSSLLKTRKPIPAATPSPSPSEPATRPPAAEPEKPPAKEEEIKLFGPKQFPRS